MPCLQCNEIALALLRALEKLDSFGGVNNNTFLQSRKVLRYVRGNKINTTSSCATKLN
ncbi:hypothetical protein KIN20_027961 [Parelaphostrongylus tenuis]|uniref:Uncharacterized protein n=1 Tax=Parelaphostrongylus tenuis TaxID=148309 RepID=A0AAD5R0Q9_PARTN|nr:hypothetical protein KIN20_027961 [Parelaphostrongylus tenuis]